MKKMVGVAILTAILVSGCTTVGRITDDMRNEAVGMCQLYNEMKVPVTVARDAAVEHWDQFTPRQKEALLDIDKRLQDLDRAGKLACLVANSETSRARLDWDWVKAVLFDTLRLVVELQQNGTIRKL